MQITIQDLGMRFGLMENAVPIAARILSRLNSLRANSTVYILAAYIFARKVCGEADVGIPRKQLLREYCLSSDQFEKALKDIGEADGAPEVKRPSLVYQSQPRYTIEKSSDNAKKRPNEATNDCEGSSARPLNSGPTKRPTMYVACTRAADSNAYCAWKAHIIQDKHFLNTAYSYSSSLLQLP